MYVFDDNYIESSHVQDKLHFIMQIRLPGVFWSFRIIFGLKTCKNEGLIFFLNFFFTQKKKRKNFPLLESPIRFYLRCLGAKKSADVPRPNGKMD